MDRKGFDISITVGPKVAAACKDPPADIEAAKREIRAKRDVARGNLQRANSAKDKRTMARIADAYERAFDSLQFFSEVNKAKVHFRVYVLDGKATETTLVATDGP
jgi:hypothetical protein